MIRTYSSRLMRWAVTLLAITGFIEASTGDAAAEPIAMYYRWHDDVHNVDGGHLRLCDWNLLVVTDPPTFHCLPNLQNQSTVIPGDDRSGQTITSLLSDPVGGISSSNIDGDAPIEFIAMTRTNAFSLSAAGGELHKYQGTVADYFLNVDFPQLTIGLGPDREAVGFGSFVDAAGLTQHMVAHTTNGMDLWVDTFEQGLGMTNQVQLLVPDMVEVDRASMTSDFQGFTVGDDDGDGFPELLVLHAAANGTDDHVRVSIFDAGGVLLRTLILQRDPIAAASSTSPHPVTVISGFIRAPIMEAGAREWIASTFEHTPGNNIWGGDTLRVRLWRYQDGGPNDGAFLGDVPVGGGGVPPYMGAVMVGMASLQPACDNCVGSNACTPDFDGDGILDIWEREGIDIDCDGDVVASEGDLPLQSWANPQRKDIFLEMDWFPFEEPTRVIVQATKQAFAAAPVDNLDGSTGINLWVDTGTLLDPQVSEDGVGGWDSCNDGSDNGIAAGLPPDGMDGGDTECLPVGDNLGNVGEIIFNPNDVIPAAFEVGTTTRPANMTGERFGIFRYMLSARPPIRQARNALGVIIPNDPITGRPNVVDLRLSEDNAGAGTCLNGIDEGADGADAIDGTLVAGQINECINPATGLFDGTRAEDAAGTCSDGIDQGADGADAADGTLVPGQPNECINPATGLFDGTRAEDAAGTCSNGVDDGADGADSRDSSLDCFINPEQVELNAGANSCTNGRDDDGDNLIDGVDSDCLYLGGGSAMYDYSMDLRHDAVTIMHELGHMLGLLHGGPSLSGPRDETDPDCIDPNSGLYDGTRREDSFGLWSCGNGRDDGSGDGADINDPDCTHPTLGYTPLLAEDGLGLKTCEDGADDDYAPNCKPNYLSVMNYSHAGIGVPQTFGSQREDGSTNPLSCTDTIDNGGGDAIDGQDDQCAWGSDLNGDGFDDGFVLDYSPPRFNDGGRGQAPLMSLIERSLQEQQLGSVPMDATDPFNRLIYNFADGADQVDGNCVGAGGAYNPMLAEDVAVVGFIANSCGNGRDDQFGFAQSWPVNNDTNGDGVTDFLGIDWNNDGTISNAITMADIDAIFACPENQGLSGNTMLGAHDWANLTYSVSDILAAGMGQFVEQPLTEEVLTQRRYREAIYRTDLAVSTTETCTALPASIDVTVENNGPNPASGVIVDVVFPAGALPVILPTGCSDLDEGMLQCVVPLLGVGQSQTFSLDIDGTLSTTDRELIVQTYNVNGPDSDEANNHAAVAIIDATSARSIHLPVSSATSSSNENSFKTADKAIDDNMGTRWSSAFSDPQWIVVDLGKTQFVNRVVLNWENAYSKAYRIEVANDPAGPWTTLFSTITGNGGTDDITNIAGLGRYVRMYSTKRSTQYGNSLWEFKVYGDPGACCAPSIDPCCAASDALNRVGAVSSSNENGSKGPEKAIDANLSTRWSSQFSDPQWIYVDLGQQKLINSVIMRWEVAASKRYDIRVSNDAANWTTVFTESNGNGDVDEIEDLAVIARYVKMYSHQRTTQYGNSLWELEVYGSEDSACLGGSGTETTLEVENGTRSGGLNRSWGMIMDSAGDTVCWDTVEMSGHTRASLRYSNGEANNDSVSISFAGATIGAIQTPNCSVNGAWEGDCATASTSIPAQTGTGTLCLIGVGPGWIGALNWLSFE